MFMIILASASPRRQEIMNVAGYDYITCPMDVDEEGITANTKEELVMSLAKAKAEACRDYLSASEATTIELTDEDYIVGADTLVFANGCRLGKPTSKDKWFEYINMLQGNTHEVITGVSIVCGDEIKTFYSSTKVSVAPMTMNDIMDYIDRDEDMDKAGGYAIQGYFAKYIHKIEGEYNNVVGFPIAKFREELNSFAEEKGRKCN